MMTVALAAREEPEFKSTHYELVFVCFCVFVTEHMVKIAASLALPSKHQRVHSHRRRAQFYTRQ